MRKNFGIDQVQTSQPHCFHSSCSRPDVARMARRHQNYSYPIKHGCQCTITEDLDLIILTEALNITNTTRLI
jgi:hypothetical protein